MNTFSSLNYYQRVQNSINYIETKLDSDLNIEQVAGQAYMSLPSLYRLFYAMTGTTVKTYIRKRRFSKAANELKEGNTTILQVAIKYGFRSHEAFTRAFKKEAGFTPQQFRIQNNQFYFEKANIMDKFFQIQDEELLKKYPEIRVMKELEPLSVASYCYVGRDPEINAWSVMNKWLKKTGLIQKIRGMRFFGFNNPSPTEEGQQEYGYEVWATIDDKTRIEDPAIQQKKLPAGLYAICHFESNPENLPFTWMRMSEWIQESAYTYGEHQWLEEHLDFNEDMNNFCSFDLYLPIKLKAETSDAS
jgi:AraC-like DNA-binding protein/DNA gyrase inhibitor GyrI